MFSAPRLGRSLALPINRTPAHLTRPLDDLGFVATAPRGEVLVLGHGGDSWELEGTPPCFFSCSSPLCSGNQDMPALQLLRQEFRRGRMRRRSAFSLAEALVALTITTLAGSVMLLAIESCLTSTSDAVDRLIADGLACQLLAEVSTKRFMTSGDTPLSISGRSAYEGSGYGRERYNDVDDYKQLSVTPAAGMWGEALGTGNDAGGARNSSFCVPSGYFTNWRQKFDIYFVSATNHSVRLTGSSTSYYRAAEVTIEYVHTDGRVIPLAKRRRVYAYLPPPG